MTGFTVGPDDVLRKHLELLRETAPRVSRIAFLLSQAGWDGRYGRVMREAAQSRAVTLVGAPLRDPIDEQEYQRVFALMTRERVEALIVNDHPANYAHRRLIADLAARARLPAIAALRDTSAEAPSEVEARNANLTFIKLDGNVGCCVNGAGLAMATMDLVKYYGGEPANFLDIGGSSSPEKVIAALRIITADSSVKAILFNIFGGITRTDDVASGIVAATKATPLRVPIVIRLTGTNEEIAMKILNENGFSASADMDEAVKNAVALATGKPGAGKPGAGGKAA